MTGHHLADPDHHLADPDHHLADPDQSHVLFFSWQNHAGAFDRKARCSGPIRTFGFRFDGDRTITDPHQSPFWIKALGLPRAGGKAPGPWLFLSPRNSSVPCHGQVFRTSSVKPPASDRRFVPIASGWQLVRSGFTNLWLLLVRRSDPFLGP